MSAAARPPEGGAFSPGETSAQRAEGRPAFAAARPPEGGAFSPGEISEGGAIRIPDPSRIRALCIDLDGTLLDTIPDLAEAANRMLESLGLARLDPRLLATFVGKGADVLIERTLAAAGRPATGPSEVGEVFTTARQAFFTHYDDANGVAAQPYPGVMDGLARLHGLGLRMACVTNKPGQFVGPLLAKFDLARWFEFSIAGDTLPVRKPDPGPMLEACRRWSLAPADVLAVGDSVNDAAAARACAMPIVLVPYGYNEGRPVGTVDADGIVDSLHDLANWLALNR